jgi:hypothetical protein
MSICISFLSKDGVSLTKRSLPALIQTEFDTFWIDGSQTEEGRSFLLAGGYPVKKIYQDVRGGPDAAIVFALTEMLKEPYEYVGLCEQDVLLPRDWFGSTKALFERGEDEGLHVGAVSPRCYEDRLLIQRDGYGLCHNLGAGIVIFSREAAQIILANYRTAWALDNRLIFSQLSGLDIGKWWCFRGGEHFITGDWNFDAILARHGLASLALTPSLATMLDQDISAQGLNMADGKMDLLRNQQAFITFMMSTDAIRRSDMLPGISGRLAFNNNGWTIFPHQIEGIGGNYFGDWTLQWAQGFGPFAWKAGKQRPELHVPVLGPCDFLLSGGQAEIVDSQSGYHISPDLPDQVTGLTVPGGCSYRTIRLTALTPGVLFYGLTTMYPQPWYPGYRFDHSKLPRVE